MVEPRMEVKKGFVCYVENIYKTFFYSKPKGNRKTEVPCTSGFAIGDFH